MEPSVLAPLVTKKLVHAIAALVAKTSAVDTAKLTKFFFIVLIFIILLIVLNIFLLELNKMLLVDYRQHSPPYRNT